MLSEQNETSRPDGRVFAGVGSTLALPEVLTKPTRDGADRLITNNRRDFSQSIEEVTVTYPPDLP